MDWFLRLKYETSLDLLHLDSYVDLGQVKLLSVRPLHRSTDSETEMGPVMLPTLWLVPVTMQTIHHLRFT